MRENVHVGASFRMSDSAVNLVHQLAADSPLRHCVQLQSLSSSNLWVEMSPVKCQAVITYYAKDRRYKIQDT